jgi:predicted transcriptional regulator
MREVRDKMEIMYDVLKVLGDGGMPKTRVMQMALLNWYQLKEELDSMEQLQLLRFAEDPDNKVYLTDKGQKFVKKYDKLMSLFDTRRIEQT